MIPSTRNRTGIEIASGAGRVRILALRDDVIRVTMTAAGALPEDASWAVLPKAREARVVGTPEQDSATEPGERPAAAGQQGSRGGGGQYGWTLRAFDARVEELFDVLRAGNETGDEQSAARACLVQVRDQRHDFRIGQRVAESGKRECFLAGEEKRFAGLLDRTGRPVRRNTPARLSRSASS